MLGRVSMTIRDWQFCFTGCMLSWDPHGVRRLDEMQQTLRASGVTDLIHDAVIDVWRANRARHEPEELFDDTFTLSMLSSRNLANRLFATINGSSSWRRAGVTASRDFAATVVHVDHVDLRLVKTPHSAARTPNFVADFDWTDSDSRLAAATRNQNAYSPPPRRPEMAPLFDMEPPNASSAVLACRDAFLVWGADLSAGLTAGWVGIPTTSRERWLAVAPVWWDEASSNAADRSVVTDAPQSSGFEDRPVPVPSLTLKTRRDEGSVL